MMNELMDYVKNLYTGIGQETEQGSLTASPYGGVAQDDNLGGLASLERAEPIEKPLDLKRMYNPRSMGEGVNTLAIGTIANILPGPDYERTKELLTLTSDKESDKNTDPNTHNKRPHDYLDPNTGKMVKGTIGHGGNMQVTTDTFLDIQRQTGNVMTTAKQMLKDEAGIDVDSVGHSMDEVEAWLSVPINSVAAARLQYLRFRDPIPTGEAAQYQYYRRFFRGR
tara:strand:+ start:16609 stop:17280 length:672 start_codon:yes stop_codon:yes gene_type:complete